MAWEFASKLINEQLPGWLAEGSLATRIEHLVSEYLTSHISLTYPLVDERNQLNMGLFNARISDNDFYQNAVEGAELSVDKTAKILGIKGDDKY